MKTLREILLGLAQFALCGCVTMLAGLVVLTVWSLLSPTVAEYVFPSVARFSGTVQTGSFGAPFWLLPLFSAFLLWLWFRRRPAARALRGRTIVRAILLCAGLPVLAGIWAVILRLAVWTSLPADHVLEQPWWSVERDLDYVVTPAAFLLALAALGALLRLRAWRSLGALACAAAGIWVYLAWDETTLELPLTAEQVTAQSVRGNERAAAELRPADPLGRPPPPPVWRPTLPLPDGPISPGPSPNQADRWRVFVVANREAIQADWDAGLSLREWFAALRGPPGNGVWTERQSLALRHAGWLHCRYASSLAVAGRGDDAITVLAPMLAGSRKLQREGIQKTCQETATFIVKTSSPSATGLRVLARALEPGGNDNFREISRRMIMMHYANNLPRYLQSSPARSWPDRAWRSLFYNPVATANLCARSSTRLAAIAAEGRGEGLRANAKALRRELLGPRFKNSHGRLAGSSDLGDVHGWVTSLWQAEDQRRALLAEVQAKLAEAERRAPASAPVKGPP